MLNSPPEGLPVQATWDTCEYFGPHMFEFGQTPIYHTSIIMIQRCGAGGTERTVIYLRPELVVEVGGLADGRRDDRLYGEILE